MSPDLITGQTHLQYAQQRMGNSASTKVGISRVRQPVKDTVNLVEAGKQLAADLSPGRTPHVLVGSLLDLVG